MKNEILWGDFETLSYCNLTEKGLQHYVEDTTTEVLCYSYAFNDEEPQCWYPEDGQPFPQRIIDHINDGGQTYHHNAQFDLQIWNYVLAADFPEAPALPLSQVRCSMTRAMAHGLPASLALLCRAIGLPIQKQTEGQRLIYQYCCRGRQPWVAGDKQLMTEYCNTDVETMRMACSVLRELSDDEWGEYHNNHRINEFGIPVDVPFATAALGYAVEVKADVDAQICELTAGEVKSARQRSTRDAWVFPRITEEQKELLAVQKGDKVTYSFDEEHRNNLLAAVDLDPDVADLLELINDAGGSSTTKYKAMVNQNVDGRVNYSLVWHGAATGRWTSKGLQVHNMVRKAFDEPESLIQDILEGYEVPTPAKTLSRLLRASITAGSLGVTFGDWSAIEGRVAPWLSEEPEAQDVLDVFRRDEDIYIHTATGMGLDDRQAGKVASLSMQFAGGAGALMRMAKNYGVAYTEDEAEELKVLWREANPWAVRFWTGLKTAAVSACFSPGESFTCGKLTFYYDGGDWLWMRRPSGNYHAYFQPKIELVDYPWGEQGYEPTVLAGSSLPKAGAKWPRRTLTPGILIENATQGAAADLMRDCVMQAKDLPVILHCHDELVVEGDYVNEVQTLMDSCPDWAAGLPLKTEVKFARRYGK